MPTISEPLWPDREERIKAIIADYVQGIDSADVLKARLHGQGLRGNELIFTHHAALHTKHLATVKAEMPREPKAVVVLERDGSNHVIRFKDAASAGKAVELLRKQPHVRFACRVHHA